MRRRPPRSLRSRVVAAAIACALIPPLLLAAVLLATDRSDPSAGTRLEAALRDHLARPVSSQAEAMLHRLRDIEGDVLLLRRYSAELLAAPEVYGGPQARTSSLGVEGQPAPTSGSDGPVRPAPGFDNPILYVKGADGAIRKVLDDGRSAVFYRARLAESYSLSEKQRLFASAALDPLLAESATGLVSHAYFVSNDGLLRIAPFVDLATMPADRDLSQLPFYAWSPDKANERGVIWTSPYVSQMSTQWVIACLCGVQLGDKLAAVVGCEVPLGTLQEAATLPLGPGSLAWLQRTDGTLIAAPTASQDALGVRSLAAASLPDATTDAKKILEGANLYLKGKTELAGPLSQLQSGEGTLLDLGESRYAAMVPLTGTGLRLGALLTSPVASELEMSRRQQGERLRALIVALCAGLLGGLLLALAVGTVVGRGIAEPLRVLAQRVREISRGGTRMSVAIHDETEVGMVAGAVQELVDSSELRS